MTLLLESDQVAFEVQPSIVQPSDEWRELVDDGLSCASDPFDDFDEDDFDDDFDDDFEEDWDDDLPTDEDNEVESHHEDGTDDPDFD
tara:strand:+ start:156 stop:416 length:261 start_codon:yes stop_codon:yes gene_type:complete